MSQDELMDLLLGFAVVALGYALYKHHQGAAEPQGTPITGIPPAPQIHQAADGSYYFDMEKLFDGAL
jgi:hypothetical protein